MMGCRGQAPKNGGVMDYLIGVVVAVLAIVVNIAGWLLVRRIAGDPADIMATGTGAVVSEPVTE